MRPSEMKNLTRHDLSGSMTNGLSAWLSKTQSLANLSELDRRK